MMVLGSSPGAQMAISELIKTLFTPGIVLFGFWVMNRDLREQIKDVRMQLETLINKNADDHSAMKQEIARMEERVNSLRAPWQQRDKQGYGTQHGEHNA